MKILQYHKYDFAAILTNIFDFSKIGIILLFYNFIYKNMKILLSMFNKINLGIARIDDVFYFGAVICQDSERLKG